MKESEIYEKMLETMTPKNWVKSAMFREDSSCLLGHVVRVNNWPGSCIPQALVPTLSSIIHEKTAFSIVGFNDDTFTQFEDVVEMLELAYKAAWDKEYAGT